MKFSPLFLLLIILATFSSCGGHTGANDGAGASDGGEETGVKESGGAIKIGGLQAIKVSGDNYRLSGTAQNGIQSNHNFDLRLDLQDGQSVSFCMFCTDKLEQGLKVKIERKGNIAIGTFSLNGNSVTHQFNNFDVSSGDIDINIDAHNAEPDMHVLVFDSNSNVNVQLGCSDTGNGCLFNSSDFADLDGDPWHTVGKAKGTFWGFTGDTDLVQSLEGPRDVQYTH